MAQIISIQNQETQKGNRESRRRDAAFERGTAERKRKAKKNEAHYTRKLQIIDRIAKRVERNRIRREERAEATKKGVKVVYSVK